MATNILTNDYRSHVGFEIIQDIENSPENTYYMFLGNHMPVTGNTIPQIADDTNDTLISAYRNMICAKVVTANDASMMIRNIPWVANTAYAMYDDENTIQDSSNFYAIVNAGAFSHVWKVLDNQMGSVSTIPPDISQISSQDIAYRTSDGYLWKYMASTPSGTIAKFGTATYFPLQANANVSAVAVAGALDVILIANAGSGYANWLTGTFGAGDVRVNGNSVTYAVTGNSNSSALNGFYTGCNLYIANGAGVGQYKTILNYFSTANGNFIVIDSPFNIAPQNGSTYQIYPGVIITGQGSQTINAAARALVNAVGNTIYRIDMLNRGQGYTYAVANVIANSVAAPIYPAQVRPIYAPFSGHGFDAYEELGATALSFSVTIANTEGNTLPATNQYQQIGILKHPLFQNVVVSFTSHTGNFIGQETVLTYDTRLLQNNVSVAAGSPNVSIANGIATQQLEPGDPIILSTAGNSAYWYTTVNAITNDSFITITSVTPWSCTSSQMSLAVIGSGTGIVDSFPTTNSIALTNLTGSFPSNTTVIGLNSGAVGVINNVSRNGTLKDFTTFVALKTYVVTPVSGIFQQNEIMFMGANLATATSTAAIHSIVANSGKLNILVSNTVGSFAGDLSGTVHGSTSGAVATISSKYSSEIIFGSSKTLYVENISPVTRSNTTSDTLNIILTF